MDVTRRELLKAGAATSVGSVAIAGMAGEVAAEHREYVPDHVTLSYDDELISQYQPQLVLDGVEPSPLAYFGLHAESTESSLNAVYGFVQYPYQEGVAGRQDSHLGDHEPLIVWYDKSTGDVERVSYAAYHWFKASLPATALNYADDAGRRPLFRVDKRYHHYYAYDGDLPGQQIQRKNLLDVIDSWLENGLEENLAVTQPFDPWDMLARKSWWRHTTGNWINAWLQALWFNLGVSDAAQTADVSEVSTW